MNIVEPLIQDSPEEDPLVHRKPDHLSSTQSVPSNSDKSGSKKKKRTTSHRGTFMLGLMWVASIGGFLVGYGTGSIAGAQIYFVDEFPSITTSQIALIVSLALLGATAGSLLSGPLSDYIGRKRVILLADLFFLVGAVIMIYTPSPQVLMIGRFILGMGVGVAAQVVPLYLSEVAPVEIRGEAVATFTLAWASGQLLAVGLAMPLSPNWRLMLGLSVVPAVLQMFGIFFLPESPRWLGKVGRHEQSKQVISRIYYPQHVQQKVDDLQEEVKKLKEATDSMTEGQRIFSLFTTYKKCIMVGCGIQIWQQLIGINAAMYYGPDIVSAAGISDPSMDPRQASLLYNVPLAGTNSLGTLVSIFFIDRYGRRFLMLRTLPFAALSWIIVTYGLYLNSQTEVVTSSSSSWSTGTILAFSGVISFIMAFSIGFSATPWAVNAEIYPLHIMGVANSIASASTWFADFLVALLFPLTMTTQFGEIATFIGLAGNCFLAWIFVYSLLPETANKPIAENVRAIIGEVDFSNDYKLSHIDDDTFRETNDSQL